MPSQTSVAGVAVAGYAIAAFIDAGLQQPGDWAASFNRGVSITPSNTVNIDGTTGTSTKPTTFSAVYIGGAGALSVVLENGVAVSFTVPSGYVLPVRCIRVNSTDTTASALIALYEV